MNEDFVGIIFTYVLAHICLATDWAIEWNGRYEILMSLTKGFTPGIWLYEIVYTDMM